MEIIEVLQGLSTVLFAMSMFILNSFKRSLDSTTESIGELNTNIATLIANDANKDKRLDLMDAEIKNIRTNIHELRNETHQNITALEVRILSKE